MSECPHGVDDGTCKECYISACNPHPKAPHGFDRNASHNADRYVCECEGWDPYDAGYEEGYRDGYEAALKEDYEHSET